MKIVMATRAVFPYHGYGGMQLYIYNLAKSLLEKGIEVEIVTSYMGKDEIFSEYYEGIKYTFLPVKTGELYKDNLLAKKGAVARRKSLVQTIREKFHSPLLSVLAFIPTILFLFIDTLRFYRFSRSVAQHLQGVEFDLLHFYDLSGYHYAKLKKKPTVMQTFGNESFYDKRKADWLGYVFFRMLIRKSFRACTVAGTCGDINSADIVSISGISRSKIRVLQNGISLGKIPAGSKQKFRDELGIKSKFVLITVNRLSPDKHVDTIIRAFGEVRKKIPDSCLISVGSGIEEKKITKLAASLGLEKQVMFLKGIDDVSLYKHLKASDVFINAADTRYLLLTVLDAMACSLPIMTTFPMENAVSNENGRVVENADYRKIADAIVEISVKSNIEKMGECSRKSAQDYGWKRVVENDIRVYESIINCGD